jgi:uncharacterized metal-binding protein YceD (DUF177 family)
VTQAEFSRPVRIDTLGSAPRAISLGANQAERAALATRFGLIELIHLSAEAEVRRQGEAVHASGRLRAEVTQSCVATGVPVPEQVEEHFDVEFRPQPVAGPGEEEIELSESELDIIFYEGSAVDLGEAVAESLSLALNPYPRSSDAEAALREAGVKSEEEAKAPGALAGLKDLLGGKT